MTKTTTLASQSGKSDTSVPGKSDTSASASASGTFGKWSLFYSVVTVSGYVVLFVVACVLVIISWGLREYASVSRADNKCRSVSSISDWFKLMYGEYFDVALSKEDMECRDQVLNHFKKNMENAVEKFNQEGMQRVLKAQENVNRLVHQYYENTIGLFSEMLQRINHALDSIKIGGVRIFFFVNMVIDGILAFTTYVIPNFIKTLISIVVGIILMIMQLLKLIMLLFIIIILAPLAIPFVGIILMLIVLMMFLPGILLIVALAVTLAVIMYMKNSMGAKGVEALGCTRMKTKEECMSGINAPNCVWLEEGNKCINQTCEGKDKEGCDAIPFRKCDWSPTYSTCRTRPPNT